MLLWRRQFGVTTFVITSGGLRHDRERLTQRTRDPSAIARPDQQRRISGSAFRRPRQTGRETMWYWYWHTIVSLRRPPLGAARHHQTINLQIRNIQASGLRYPGAS